MRCLYFFSLLILFTQCRQKQQYLVWSDEKIEWLIDNNPYSSVYKNRDGKAGWPFNNEFHLILNLAVGGNWGGKYGMDVESFPQEFVIDYVRVYAQKPDIK